MPVMTKQDHQILMEELNTRFIQLGVVMETRELTSGSEGTARRKAYWRKPGLMCATKGSTLDIRLAIADLKSCLSELGKLK